jgi:hypothetical protein
MALPTMSHATTQTLTVTSTADGGPGSLREAITAANHDSGDTIIFNIPGSGPFTITLTSGILPFIKSSMSVIGGTTPATGITISGNNSSQVFAVFPPATLTLKYLT